MRKSTGSRLIAILLCCSVLLLAGCDYIKTNWQTPMGPSLPTTEENGTDSTKEPVPSQLLITEVMSNNSGSLILGENFTPDWIEIYNSGSTPVSLTGYMLSDSARNPDKFIFKTGTLAAGAYLLVYADGNVSDIGSEPLVAAAAALGREVAPFGIDRSGEELLLTGPDGNVADQWNVPEMPADISYGRNGPNPDPNSPKVFFANPTPGTPNSTDGKEKAEEAIEPAVTTLLINEYCSSNSTFYDERGDYPDWVELYNAGRETVDLTGYMFSDNLSRIDKWTFPETKIEPKAYLLLMLVGTDPLRPAPAPVPQTGGEGERVERRYVDFKLGPEDEQLLLSDTRGRPVAVASVEDLPSNVSHGRLPDNPETWAYFPRPTPGEANTTASFFSLEAAYSLEAKTVLINEVFAQDVLNPATPAKDWIELYNNTDKPLDLNGYGLSDDPKQPFLQVLNEQVINPKSTLVIEPDKFGISPDGETIVLTNPDGFVEDAFSTGYLRPGNSSGRQLTTGNAAGGLDRFFYVTPTRGKLNNTNAYLTYSEIPRIIAIKAADSVVVDNLYIDQAVKVSLTVSTPDTIIYYTLDGSEPTTASSRYEDPLTVDKSLVVKAIAQQKDNLLSDTAVRTFLKEKPHTLPVVSVSGNPAAILGNNGILINSENYSEVPANFSFYEADGVLGISANAGLELQGQYSRKEAQKSLEVKFRGGYERSDVTYPFFPDYDVNTFRRLVLRTSGQDWQYTKVRDAFMTRVVQEHVEVDMMAVRNCVLYVNGKYHGLYEVREKIDKFYIESHYGVDPDELDLIKGTGIVMAGDTKDYRDLLAYVRANDMRNQAAYQKVMNWIDAESLMDFVIVEAFFSNADSGNKKFWRQRSEDGKWRWSVFDLDWALFPTSFKNNRLKGDLLDPAGHGTGNFFHTVIQVKLMQNPDFEERFINRYANFLNTIFTTENLLKILDENIAIVEPEMERQIARWGKPVSMAGWRNNVATLRRVISEIRKVQINYLQNDFNISQARMKQLFPQDFP